MTDTPNNLSVIPDKPDQGAIDLARNVLTRCESGETLSLVVVEERAGRYSLEGSHCRNRHEKAGMLLEMAVCALQGDDA